MKKFLAVTAAVCLLLSLLAGCGAASYDNATAADMPAANMEAAEEYYGYADDAVAEGSLTSTDRTETALPENQKIITTVHMNAETDDMDPLLNRINAQVQALGGYMESQEIYNGSSYNSYRYRYAYMTIRVPADQLDSFVSHVADNANVVSKNISTENVTLSYIATESRITALETEQTRLLELLAMAETMEDLLLIESRLTEVRTELEQVNSVLRSYDNRINYSTVHLELTEVTEYTETDEPETVWERISEGFANSMENLGEGLVDFFVFIVVAFPYLLPVIVVGGVVLLVVLISKGKKNKKNPPAPKEENK